METSISDAKDFIDNPLSKEAVRKAIANVTNVPAEYVDVDLFEKANQSRRLLVQQVGMRGSLLVTYAIAVGGDAPASVKVTGEEVSNKMTSSNSGTISDAITSKVDESFGAGVFAVSVQTVHTPDVTVAPSGLSTSTIGLSDTTTASVQSSTVTVEATTSVSSRNFLQPDFENGACGIVSAGLHTIVVVLLVAFFQ
jgi:hypothetical protein